MHRACFEKAKDQILVERCEADESRLAARWLLAGKVTPDETEMTGKGKGRRAKKVSTAIVRREAFLSKALEEIIAAELTTNPIKSTSGMMEVGEVVPVEKLLPFRDSDQAHHVVRTSEKLKKLVGVVLKTLKVGMPQEAAALVAEMHDCDEGGDKKLTLELQVMLEQLLC